MDSVKDWLDTQGNDRWLLIYDNMDNPKILGTNGEDAYDLQSYFPEVYQGSIIITSHWKTLRIGEPLEIKNLSDNSESISLFSRASGRELGKVGLEPEIVGLLEQLDGLPLALATAGAYLGLTCISVRDYLRLYETSWLGLQQISQPLPTYDHKLYTTRNLSFKHIESEHPSAAKLLRLWYYFDSQDLYYDLLAFTTADMMPPWLSEVAATELTFRSAMETLQEHALAESLTGSDGFSIHRCVHAWVEAVLCPIDSNGRIPELPVVPQPYRSGPIDSPRYPHIRRYLGLARNRMSLELMDEYKVKDFKNVVAPTIIGMIYLQEDRPFKAQASLMEALIVSQKQSVKDDEYTLKIMATLAHALHAQGRNSEARKVLQDALSNYAGSDGTQGNLSEAEAAYQRCGEDFKDASAPLKGFSLIISKGLLSADFKKYLDEAIWKLQLARAQVFGDLSNFDAQTSPVVESEALVQDAQASLDEAKTIFGRANAHFSDKCSYPPGWIGSTRDTLNIVELGIKSFLEEAQAIHLMKTISCDLRGVHEEMRKETSQVLAHFSEYLALLIKRCQSSEDLAFLQQAMHEAETRFGRLRDAVIASVNDEAQTEEHLRILDNLRASILSPQGLESSSEPLDRVQEVFEEPVRS